MILLNTNGTVKTSRKIASDVGGGPTLSNHHLFGSSVTSLGDLDGDGLTDLAVAAKRGGLPDFSWSSSRAVPNVGEREPNVHVADTGHVLEQAPSVLTVTATDEDIPPQPITLSIVGGRTRQIYITGGGALFIFTPPDFDMPTDANGNNIYEVTIQASNNVGGLATQTILVTVMLPFDAGDAIDTGTGPGNYNTSAADNGPPHDIVAGLRIGLPCSTTILALSRMRAARTTSTMRCINDDDGVVTMLPRTRADRWGRPNHQCTGYEHDRNSGHALFGWIDYNGDGVFDNTTERCLRGRALGFFMPGDVGISRSATGVCRVNLRSLPSQHRHRRGHPTGRSSDGEVEDYPVTIIGRAPARPTAPRPRRSPAASVAGRRWRTTTSLVPRSRRSAIWMATASATWPSAPQSDSVPHGWRGACAVHECQRHREVEPEDWLRHRRRADARQRRLLRSFRGVARRPGWRRRHRSGGRSEQGRHGRIHRGAVYVLFLNANGTVKSSQKIASGTAAGRRWRTVTALAVRVARWAIWTATA